MSGPIPDQIKHLLNTPAPADLGPTARTGTRRASEVESDLNRLLPAAGLSTQRQQLIRALLLLWHDHLDESHEISQGISSADGSFIHAIMHRREPDYWNAKYWFRRVGEHPCFPEIAVRVGGLLKERGAGELAAKLLPDDRWDAFAFVDACEQAEVEHQNVACGDDEPTPDPSQEGNYRPGARSQVPLLGGVRGGLVRNENDRGKSDKGLLLEIQKIEFEVLLERFLGGSSTE